MSRWKKWKTTLGLCLSLSTLLQVQAQDLHFSQFYAAPLYLSPSLAGATDGARLAMTYRNQWPGISTAFSTMAVSFDNFFPAFNSGLGLQLIQDRAGPDLYPRRPAILLQPAHQRRVAGGPRYSVCLRQSRPRLQQTDIWRRANWFRSLRVVGPPAKPENPICRFCRLCPGLQSLFLGGTHHRSPGSAGTFLFGRGPAARS